MRGGSTAEPMELGMMEETDEESEEEEEDCQVLEERKIKPIFSGRKINFENISGPKTLMVAWKRLISQSNNFKKESENFLKSARMRGETVLLICFRLKRVRSWEKIWKWLNSAEQEKFMSVKT